MGQEGSFVLILHYILLILKGVMEVFRYICSKIIKWHKS